jgi:hypothetical protein
MRLNLRVGLVLVIFAVGLGLGFLGLEHAVPSRAVQMVLGPLWLVALGWVCAGALRQDPGAG